MRRSTLTMLVVSAVVLGFHLKPAFGHGEHNLEPFFRLRGITFLDVQYSDDELAVNDRMKVTGKFRLMESWPRTVETPELAYLNLLVPGPRVAVTARRLNGEFVQNAFHIEMGEIYDFELELRARDPGEWHLHPLVNLQHTGSLVGPGRTVTITGDAAAATRELTLPATGERIDLETFGKARVFTWHGIFLALGLAWLLFWAARPLLARYLLLANGAEENEILTRRDRRVATGFAVALVLITGGGIVATSTGAPPTIPHQVQDTWELPDIEEPDDVRLEEPKFRYSPMTRTMTLEVTATNEGDRPVEVHRFATSYITFINEGTTDDWPIPEGSAPMMQVDPPGPLAPGETRRLTLTMQDAIWETDSFINYQQPQVTAAGLVLFIDAAPPPDGMERPTVMVTTDREAPGVPWDRVRSVNEAFSAMKVDFGAFGGG